jgi:hypothetical protein
MLDRDVRTALRARLDEAHAGESDTLVVDELDLCGVSRIDVAVINGALSGYEIKSAADTLRRLPAQADVYSRIFDHVVVVAANKHIDHVLETCPNWWGLCVADWHEGRLTLMDVRRPGMNPSPEASHLVQLLWRDEALSALDSFGLASGIRSKPRKQLWDRLASELELSEVQSIVRSALKRRTAWRGSLPPR